MTIAYRPAVEDDMRFLIETTAKVRWPHGSTFRDWRAVTEVEVRRQLAFTKACQTKRRVRIASARQIGKSVGLGQAFNYRCQHVPGSKCVLFGLNGVAVRENFWEPIVKTMLGKYRVKALTWERMVVEYPNGSRLLCTGTDDLAHVQNVLGNRFKGAILGIDEMQSQRPSAVRALLTTVLPPP